MTVAAIVAAFAGIVGIETAARSLLPATLLAVVVWLILALNSETWARVRLIPVVLIALAFASLGGITAVKTQAIEPRTIRMANTPRGFHHEDTETYKNFVFVGTAYGLSIGVIGSWCINAVTVRRNRRCKGIENTVESPK
jgi:hypothetical protein